MRASTVSHLRASQVPLSPLLDFTGSLAESCLVSSQPTAPAVLGRHDASLEKQIVTTTSGTTAPLGSVMVPETVASWVCDHALTEMNAANIADDVYGRKLSLTWASLMINSL